ncbi:hypothetical protein ACFST9_18645 [Hymenobacter monticola]|uniref:DoxX family protein n=1 Tax=Hymenobacter monticola TaxID=1705399 RepID=A0ABY4AYT7_9BACT|nr:hypothetical protein [Hymenobacter monticola]UOE32073.1 hypothetical protein MTP16_13120 [Hymenobacter monticola]
MPSKTYYLDPARTDAITASWGFFYRNFTVSYAGQELAATDPDAKIAKGRSYPLPDGRVFSARLIENSYPQHLELLLDGRPVPGSGTDPHEQVKQAWYLLLVLGVLNIGLGLLTEFGQLEVLRQLGLGWGSLVEGVAFVALGWLGYYRGSVPAFTTAFVLLVLDGIVSIGSAVATNHSPAIGGLFMRVFFCVIVFRGMKAARQLRQERAIAATELF